MTKLATKEKTLQRCQAEPDPRSTAPQLQKAIQLASGKTAKLVLLPLL